MIIPFLLLNKHKKEKASRQGWSFLVLVVMTDAGTREAACSDHQ